MDTTDLSNLVKSDGKDIYGFCHKLAKNKADADDLYQETFLKAMELYHKIDKDNNPKGFLTSIAVGLWKNKCRKYAWRQRIAPVEELHDDVNNCYMLKVETTPEDIIISNELRVMVQNAGLPIEVLIEYVTLFQQGDETIEARKQLLTGQRKLLMEKMEDMKKTLERLDYKIERYEKGVVTKEKELKRPED